MEEEAPAVPHDDGDEDSSVQSSGSSRSDSDPLLDSSLSSSALSSASQPPEIIPPEAATPSTTSSSPALRLRIITWNLQGKKAPTRLHSLFFPGSFDLIAVGTQECERSIEQSVLYSSHKRWESVLSSNLGDDFSLVAAHTLMATHIAVFARKEVLHRLARVHSAHVSSGLLGGRVGNKGGVGVAFSIGRSRCLFVCCHFTAFQEKVEQRNADFAKIDRELNLRIDPEGTDLAPDEARPAAASSSASSSSSVRSVSEGFDFVFWFGDLNYRVNGNRDAVEAALKAKMMEVLLANDQLLIERRRGNVFGGFAELPIEFPPTYKFDKRSRRYDTTKKRRIPAWTDRILFRPTGDVVPLQYTSHNYMVYSDHRPVIGDFLLTVHDGFPPKNECDSAAAKEEGPAKSRVCTVM